MSFEDEKQRVDAKPRKKRVGQPEAAGSANATEVLARLHTLLEEDAPDWYGQEQRKRASAALRSPTEVLVELCVLLEQFSPSWYPEKLRSRVLAALQLPTNVLLEVCGLLEEYAPLWYTEEQHDRTVAALKGLGLLEEEGTAEEST